MSWETKCVVYLKEKLYSPGLALSERQLESSSMAWKHCLSCMCVCDPCGMAPTKAVPFQPRFEFTMHQGKWCCVLDPWKDLRDNPRLCHWTCVCMCLYVLIVAGVYSREGNWKCTCMIVQGKNNASSLPLPYKFVTMWHSFNQFYLLLNYLIDRINS